MADDATRSPEEGGRIVDEPIGEALAKRYLAYALSTITSRALPDVRDGLKPVHRRVLYAMKRLNLTADAAFRKSAKVVGDVMGDYHPHGDQSIYDALVRLAQDFNSRYPLIDGQGNFGNIDGDNPAAMRYTESRMTKAAEALLEGIDEDAVEFRPSYDGSKEEPVVLPAAFPNLLANGSSGIAVGMATNIPPHNVAELIDGCLLLIENSKATTDDCSRSSPGLTSRPVALSLNRQKPSAKLMILAVAASACARGGRRKISAAACGASSSPKFRTWCRSRS
jgi:topoisomerase-4 subunit A